MNRVSLSLSLTCVIRIAVQKQKRTTQTTRPMRTWNWFSKKFGPVMWQWDNSSRRGVVGPRPHDSTTAQRLPPENNNLIKLWAASPRALMGATKPNAHKHTRSITPQRTDTIFFFHLLFGRPEIKEKHNNNVDDDDGAGAGDVDVGGDNKFNGDLYSSLIIHFV